MKDLILKLMGRDPHKPKKWFIEPMNNPNSNTIKIMIYRHGCPYSSARMTLTDECKDWELEKNRFVNVVRQIYDESRD